MHCTATCPKLTILPRDDHDDDGHDGDYNHFMMIIINEDNDDDEEPASFAKELKLVQITSYYVRAVPEVHVHVPSVISDALA